MNGRKIVFVYKDYCNKFLNVNLEALSCGTPVITYNTGGSHEAVDVNTGIIVEKGDVTFLSEVVETILKNGKGQYSDACRNRSVRLYNKNDRYRDYLSLYQNLL